MKMDCEKQRDLQKLSLIVSKYNFEEANKSISPRILSSSLIV